MEAAQPSGRLEGSSPAPGLGRGQSPAVASTTRGRAGGVGTQGNATGGMPGQATRGGSAASNGGSMEDSRFECNICLDQVNEPVVTLCGHLFCWPCLYRWLNSNHNICPVCKAGVTKENVIPLYGRGTEQVDPRTKPRDHDDVPTRPAAQRPEARPQMHPHGFMGGMPFGTTGFSNTHYAAHGMSFSAGFGFFPSLFGLQFQTFSPPTPSHAGSTATMTTEEAQQAFLSRLLLLLGIFVVMCLLMF